MQKISPAGGILPCRLVIGTWFKSVGHRGDHIDKSWAGVIPVAVSIGFVTTARDWDGSSPFCIMFGS